MSIDVKTAFDGASVVTLVASMAGWLPPIAAALTIVWVSMQVVMHWDEFKTKLKKLLARKKK